MVLFKRKPVQFLQHPKVEDDSAEVWHIPQTGEVFVSYEDYLNRMDFFNQARFICEITGHSALTFFDALASEQAGAREVEQAFPEALKGPILRRVQFQTISRIDALVDMIYDEFKSDYYPGEAVTVTTSSGERLTGTVRDKARLGSKVLPDGTLTAPHSRYFTTIDGRPHEEAAVDSENISRDRKVFTKSVLRSFIKKTVTREAWNGAPWLVKHDVAVQYRIDTRVPPHLRHDTKLLERKQFQAQKKASQTNGTPMDRNGMSPTFPTHGPARLPELKPAPKSHKSKAQQQLQQQRLQQQQQLQQQRQQQQQQQHHVPHVNGGPNLFLMHDPMAVPYIHGNHPFQHPVALRQNMPPPPQVFSAPSPPPPPPPPKYPMEDLQLEPRDDYIRPPLTFLCGDPPEGVVDSGAQNDKILMKSIGPLLETWVTLNVYCEIFKLDSFTFDDFVQAMEITDEDTPCEMIIEIHCAVLKLFVNAEGEGEAKLQVNLPELDEEEEDEEEEEEDDEEPTPEPEPELRRSGRATRSSLAKQEMDKLKAETAPAEKEKTPEPEIKHRAPDVLADFDWIEQLRKRDFQDGGWEMMLVGVLYQLSKNERKTEVCEEILAQLVPPNVEPSRETVREHYGQLDLNLRVAALQILCMLTADTKAFRAYMEDCAETMTGYRKEKIEWQRNRKQALEDLKPLQDQHKILLPDNMPASPTADKTQADNNNNNNKENGTTNGDVKMTGANESADPSEEAGDSDEDPKAKHLRRGGDRAAERRRKREEQARKKESEIAASKAPKQSKQFLKVVKDIQKKEDYIKQCEEEVATIDNDLREADCGRTRVLGRDRFWNRYYWFERNGMPYGGLPDSSTAEAGYANGCIWVQGPDDMERQGYIDLPQDLQEEYKAKFKMTVPQRKKMEEGKTSIFNAGQWGYYAEPSELDSLLHWLDPRGYQELKLRKELLTFKEKIVQGMENRKRYLGLENDDNKDKEEPETGKKDDTKRMTTRTKTQPVESPPSRCLNWSNTMAIEELGHLHSEPPPPPTKSRKPKKSRS